MKIKIPVIILPILILLFSYQLKAEEAPDLDEIFTMSFQELMNIEVSVTSKRNENVKDAPGVVTVITRDEMRQYGFRTFEDVLNFIPGFTTTKEVDRFAAGLGLNVRGSTTDFGQTVLILVDGQSINDFMTGSGLQFTPNQFLENIKQMEVIRGPSSALYGANAFLAVINIVTDGMEFENQNIAEVKIGDNDGRNATVKVEHVINDDFQIALSGQYYNYQGDDIGIPDVTITDPLGTPITYSGHVYRDALEMKDIFLRTAFKDVLLKINWQQYEANTIDGMGWAADGTLTDALGIDHTGVFRSSNLLFGESEHIDVTLNYATNLSDTLRIDATAKWAKYESSTHYPLTQALVRIPFGIAGDAIDEDASIDNDYISHIANFDTLIDWTGYEDHAVILGAGYNRSDADGSYIIQFADLDGDGVQETYVENPSFTIPEMPEEAVRKSYSVYLQDTWRFASQFTLTSGIRFDDYNDFGNTTNYRMALLYKPTDKWSLKTMYGTAFRAPSVIEAEFVTPPLYCCRSKYWPRGIGKL